MKAKLLPTDLDKDNDSFTVIIKVKLLHDDYMVS